MKAKVLQVCQSLILDQAVRQPRSSCEGTSGISKRVQKYAESRDLVPSLREEAGTSSWFVHCLTECLLQFKSSAHCSTEDL